MRRFLLGLLLSSVLGCAKAEPKPNEDPALPGENGGVGGESGIGGEGGNTEVGGADPGGQGGIEQGGNEPGGNEQGGNAQGGNEPGGNEPGGNEQGGNEPGGNAQGGAGSEQGGAGGKPPKPCENKPIINELMTAKEIDGKLDEKYEFLELLAVGNDSSCEISLLEYKVLQGSNVIWEGGASPGFKKGKRFVLGGQSYAQDSQPYQIGFSQSSLPSQGGCIEIRKSDTLVDRVCYGNGATVAPVPSSGQSVGRSPDGVDTDNDAADFKLFDQPSPNAKNP